MAEMKDFGFGVWKKPSNNSRNRSYRDGKPKDTRLLFREREVAKSDSRHKERHNNESHKKERRIHSHKRIEEDNSRRHHHRLSPTVRKHDSRERVLSKTRRDSNEELVDKRSKKHKCKHRRQHEDEKTVDEPVVSISDDKIKKCRHTHRHRHHKKCKHRHHEEKPSSSPKAIPVEVRSQEHCSPSRMQKPSERIKTNAHLEVTPLDSKEIYAEGDKIFVNINFNKVAMSELKSDFPDIKSVAEQPTENKQLIPAPIITSELSMCFSKPGEPPKKDVKLVSKSKTEFDIFWDDNSDRKSDKSHPENSIEADIASRDISFDGSPKRKSENESNFVPRSLLTDVKCLSLTTNAAMSETPLAATPPQTPPIVEDRKSLPSSPDQSMPTPTQDESQVDSLRNSTGSITNSVNSPVTPLSSTVTTPKSRITDIYDPEAPLESPENGFESKLVKNGNKAETSLCNISPPKKSFSPDNPKNDVSKLRSSAKAITKTPKSAEKSNAFASQVSSTTVSATSTALSNLMRLLPQTSSHFPTNPPPNSLIAQIQQTVSQQPKGVVEQQQLHQLLQTASSITSILKSLPVANQTSIASIPSKSNHSHDVNEVVDMEVDSPRSPATQAPITSTTNKSINRTNFLTSNPAMKPVIDQIMRAVQKQTSNHKVSSSHTEVSSSAAFKRPVPVDSMNKRYHHDNISGSASLKSKHQNHGHHSSVKTKVTIPNDAKGIVKRPSLTTGPSAVGVKLGDVAVVDDVPSSAVELLVKEKYLKKLNRQERVVEEVKLVLKPYYQRREVTKEEYKEILRKSVPKICHSKTGEINPVKIKQLVEEYIKRMKHLRKKSKTKSSNSNANVAKL